MTEPRYTARIDAIHRPFAITLDDVSFRAPFTVRITWRPTDAQAGLLVPDWIDGQPAISCRDYDKGNTTRWFIRATTYGFRDVTLETQKEGTRMTFAPVAPPKTRTRGRWFAWECGRWVDKPNHDHHQACYVRCRQEYWHTPPWEPGQDMTPNPPTDPEHRKQKAQP